MGGPNTGNILDPPNRTNNWFVSQYRLEREALNKQISLDDMSFTLDDFDKLCSGRYNAGSLVLDKRGRLDLVNNHVDALSFLNGKDVSATDSFAIRRAFANALEAAGLSEERMADVRARLGLRRDNNTYNGGLCFTALKRQEVREIIDTYIDELNAHRDDDHQLRTQAQQRQAENYSPEQIKFLNKVRKAVEASNNDTVKNEFDKDLLHALDFMSTSDYSDKKIYDDDKLHEMALFFEDFEDRIEELIHTDAYDMAIWQHENPGELRFLPVSTTLAIGVDPETKKVLLKSQGIGESKVVVFSSGFKPERLLEIINDANKRLHTEGNKRGLVLTGGEDIQIEKHDFGIDELPKKKTKDEDFSIKESPRSKKKVDEPIESVGALAIKESPKLKKNKADGPRGDNKITPKKGGKKDYRIINENIDEVKDEPKANKKQKVDRLIPLPGDDDDDDSDNDPIIG